MAYKVFLFDEHSWLYCSDVAHKDGIWTGWVENGAWYLHFDENTVILKACQGRNISNPVTERKVKLTWACDKNGFHYNDVIENARKRYEAGEEANFVIAPLKKRVKEDYDNEVAF
jgi:hypothetical protein